MKRAIACLALTLLAAGCDRQAKRERTTSDADAVAQVKAAQNRHPPPVPLAPQPLAQIERTENPVGAGCAFLLDSAWTDAPVAVAGPERAVVKFDGRTEILAADGGSPEIAPGTRTRYDGKGLSLRLTRGPGKGERASGAARRWPGSLTLFDRYERIVYFTPGLMRCPA